MQTRIMSRILYNIQSGICVFMLVGLLQLDMIKLTSCNETSVIRLWTDLRINPYPTAFPYGNGMVLHFYQQQESSTTKTVHKVINKGLKTYV